jgi:hypothetical protein
MQDIDKTETRSIEEMSLFELSRWCALMEGVNIIADKCDDKNINFDTVELEPLSLRKYVEGTCDNICKQLQNQHEKKKAQKMALIAAKEFYDAILDDKPIEVRQ